MKKFPKKGKGKVISHDRAQWKQLFTSENISKMETSTQVTLSWKEFEQCAGNAFKGLYQDSDFTDVTLACMDDIQIKAHKVILTASSPFFKNILAKNAHSHPLLYLKGINGKVLEALLAFMYMGESKVLEADLKDFLDTADELKIKGLFDVAKDFVPPVKSESAFVFVDQGEPANNIQDQHQQFDGGQNWVASEEKAFLELQAIEDTGYRPLSNQTKTMIKCPMCKFEAASVANLNIHGKSFHPTQAEVKAKQQLQQGKLKKETVRCNICQRVLINDKRNLLDHCKLYHMNA